MNTWCIPSPILSRRLHEEAPSAFPAICGASAADRRLPGFTVLTIRRFQNGWVKTPDNADGIPAANCVRFLPEGIEGRSMVCPCCQCPRTNGKRPASTRHAGLLLTLYDFRFSWFARRARFPRDATVQQPPRMVRARVNLSNSPDYWLILPRPLLTRKRVIARNSMAWFMR